VSDSLRTNDFHDHAVGALPAALPAEELPDVFDGEDRGARGHRHLLVAGTGLATPKKKPKGGELTLSDKEYNSQISSFRAPIERLAAHFKNWKIFTPTIGARTQPTATLSMPSVRFSSSRSSGRNDGRNGARAA
jgi:hypothetical protein